MPFVGADLPPPLKRRWRSDDGTNDGFSCRDERHIYMPPHRRTMPLPKRTRTSDDYSTPDNSFTPTQPRRPSQQKSTQQYTRPPLTERVSSVTLTPCHICHRRPRKRSELDSFAECEGCGERTCFVCLRECQGWGRDDQGRRGSMGDALSEQEVLSRSFHMEDAEQVETAREVPSTEKGWVATGHRETVCSRCCIERGSEGDIVCLGCLARLDGV